MHQPEIIILLFAAVAALGGGRGQACAAISDRARHNRTCIELRSAPAGNETQSRDRFLFFSGPVAKSASAFFFFPPLTPAVSERERSSIGRTVRIVLHRRVELAYFKRFLPVFSNRVFQIWTLVAPSTRS
jgi:hypothetical protein